MLNKHEIKNQLLEYIIVKIQDKNNVNNTSNLLIIKIIFTYPHLKSLYLPTNRDIRCNPVR